MGLPDPIEDAQFYTGVPMRRLMAFLVDIGVVFGLWLFLMGIGFSIFGLGGGMLGLLFLPVFIGAGFFYRWLMLAQRACTLGMRLAGIEMRNPLGEPVDPVASFVNSLGFYVSLCFPPLVVLNWIAMGLSARHQTLYDLIVGCVVINRPEN